MGESQYYFDFRIDFVDVLRPQTWRPRWTPVDLRDLVAVVPGNIPGSARRSTPPECIAIYRQWGAAAPLLPTTTGCGGGFLFCSVYVGQDGPVPVCPPILKSLGVR